MSTPFLTINDAGQLTCEIGDDVIVVQSQTQLIDLCPYGAMCSSTVDFPSEYTSDEAVLALCDWLNSDCR